MAEMDRDLQLEGATSETAARPGSEAQPDEPAGEPARAGNASPPPAKEDSRSPRGDGQKPPSSPSPPGGQAPGIGDEGVEKLEAYVAEKRREAALTENKRLRRRISALEAEVDHLRRHGGDAGEILPDDEDLARALQESGLEAGDLITHYNHGHGRIVLVPKAGDRVVVDLGRAEGRKEVS